MRKRPDIVCKYCGKLFHPVRKTSMFCCKECAGAYNKEHGVLKKSEEAKRKMSEARKGRTPWNKGRKMTDEEIAKMKEAVKLAWTDEKKEVQRNKQKRIWKDPVLLAKHSEKMRKVVNSNIEKISVSTRKAMQRDDVKEHMRESFNRVEVLEKRKETNLERYGVNWIVQSEMYTKAGFKGKTNEGWAERLKTAGIEYEREFPLDNFIYDFKIGNTLLEINPTYTHSSTVDVSWYGFKGVKDRLYYKNKMLVAKKYGFNCIMVWDWDDIDKVLNLLTPVKYKVSGHKCRVQEIGIKEANGFLEQYHFQGSCKGASVAIGLYYGDVLVAVSTYGASRYNKNYEYEWLRYATNNEYLVQGGSAHKLHDYFVERYKPKSIISYCDYSKFNGSMFEHLGYIKLKQNSPSLHFHNIKTGKHYTQTEVNKLGACRLLGIPHVDRKTSGKDNIDIMKDNGFLEVYDCGQGSYGWTKC